MATDIDKTKICIYLLICIAAMQIFSLLKVFDFKPFTALCGILILFLAYNLITDSFKKMALIFFSLGALINIYTNQPLQSWIDGINYMLNISSILVIMQLFTIPIKLDDYEEALTYLILRTFKNERMVYMFTLVVTHLFSSFLLFGTIPVMISLLGEPLKKIIKDYRRFTSTALTRSYSMVVMWAPGAVNILLVITATGAKWVDMFFLGIILSVWGILLSYLTQLKYLSDKPLKSVQAAIYDKKQNSSAAYKKLYFILGIVIVLVLLIMFFDQLAFGDNTSRVMLASLVVSGAWLATFIKHPKFSGALSEYLNVSLAKTIDLAVLYISLGVFSKALELSGILRMFYPFVGVLAEVTGLFMLPVISILVFLLSLIGLHPFIILVILGKIVMSLNLPFSAAVIATALIFGSSISYMTSPFAGIVLTSAKYLDATPVEVGFKWNGLFGLLYFITGTAVIMLWALFIN